MKESKNIVMRDITLMAGFKMIFEWSQGQKIFVFTYFHLGLWMDSIKGLIFQYIPNIMLILYQRDSVEYLWQNKRKHIIEWKRKRVFYEVIQQILSWKKVLSLLKQGKIGTVEPRNTESQGNKKFHLFLADFCYFQ